MSQPRELPADGGWGSFVRIWLGQVVSMLGSGLTHFALGVWVYSETGSATQFALIFVFGALPALIAAPLVGTLVDRWDRRRTMILSDAGTALATLALVGLLWADSLAVWQVYGLVIFATVMMSFQIPAFTAAVPLLVPRSQLGRVAGLMQLGPAAARILAPLGAGLLLPLIGLEGIIAVDLATFLFAVGMTLAARVPRVAPGAGAARPSLRSEMAAGWRYLADRPAFLGLIAYFAVVNLLFGFTQVLATPLVLSFAGARELGLVLSLGSAGLLAGSLLMSAWGGPRNRLLGIVGFGPLLALGMVLTGMRASVAAIAAGTFLCFLAVPVMNGCDQALFQVKVEPAFQGRVFAFKRMFAQLTAPVAYLVAGPLSDRVLEPGMQPGGDLAATFGGLLGSGPGRGIGLAFVLMGVLQAAAAAFAFLHPRLRGAQEALPDALPEPAGP